MLNRPKFVDVDLAVCDLLIHGKVKLQEVEDAFATSSMREEGLIVFNFIKKHFIDHKTIPSRDTIFSRLKIAWDYEAPEPLSYYANEIRRRSLITTLSQGVKGAYDSLGARDPDTALEVMKSAISHAEKLTNYNLRHDIDYAESAIERLERYDRVSQTHGIVGTSFPWATMNAFTGGMEDEDLVTIVASTGKGKTWIMCDLMAHVINLGKKCLFASMEMSTTMIALRMDSLFNHMAFDSIRRGQLSDMGQGDTYKKYLHELYEQQHDQLRILSKVSSRTVQDLNLQIAAFEPEMLFVDGVYIMRGPDPRASKHEHREEVIEDLKFTASQFKIPVVCTAQFNRSVLQGRSEEKLKGGMGDIGASYAISQYSDSMIGLFQNQEMKKQGRMILRMLKNRHGDTGTDIPLISDFTNMDFKELPTNMGIPVSTNNPNPANVFNF